MTLRRKNEMQFSTLFLAVSLLIATQVGASDMPLQEWMGRSEELKTQFIEREMDQKEKFGLRCPNPITYRQLYFELHTRFYDYGERDNLSRSLDKILLDQKFFQSGVSLSL